MRRNDFGTKNYTEVKHCEVDDRLTNISKNKCRLTTLNLRGVEYLWSHVLPGGLVPGRTTPSPKELPPASFLFTDS